MAKKDKTRAHLLPKRLADKAVEMVTVAGMTVPDCLAEQLAVDLQQIIADAAQQTANDEQSILGELRLQLDDCLMGGTDGMPDTPTEDPTMPPGAP